MINDEQRKARKLGIGGSDMPIILGLSTYKTPYQLYLEKTSDVVEAQEESSLQYWGNLLENVIREEFATRNQVVVETPDTLVGTPLVAWRANKRGSRQFLVKGV